MKEKPPRKTNREMAQTDPTFLAACKHAGAFPSRNQYRKFKCGRGRVAQLWHERIKNLTQLRQPGIGCERYLTSTAEAVQ